MSVEWKCAGCGKPGLERTCDCVTDVVCRVMPGSYHEHAVKIEPWRLDETQRMRAVIWAAWRELNTIRARDGAPEGIDHEYFSSVVDACETILGDDTKPWPNKLWLQQDGSFSFDEILGRVKPSPPHAMTKSLI